ncbi:MAG: hypothetical protein LBK63_03220 [Treponema sp.]|jgi:hypothetical protein|nr:hypothetical protein [Treponema sp.]
MHKIFFEKKWIFLILAACAVLVFSLPYAIFLVFVIFPCIFKIIDEVNFNKAIVKIFLFNISLIFIIFFNKPFVNYFPLFAIAVVYFGFMITLGEIVGMYKKRNIVPFVENYEYTKGKDLNTFEVENYTVAPLICYDSMFIRNYFRDKKADLYVVASNDIFSEHTILSLLHEAYGLLNSRTLGIPLIQATQNGPSFYVDYEGKLNELANTNERREVITVTVKTNKKSSLSGKNRGYLP